MNTDRRGCHQGLRLSEGGARHGSDHGFGIGLREWLHAPSAGLSDVPSGCASRYPTLSALGRTSVAGGSAFAAKCPSNRTSARFRSSVWCTPTQCWGVARTTIFNVCGLGFTLSEGARNLIRQLGSKDSPWPKQSRSRMSSKFNHASQYRVAFAFLLALDASGTSRHAAAEPANASEPEKALCAQSFEQAQRLRNDSQYLAANQELLKCANPKCGDALFQECSKLYGEIQAAIPSVVFEARADDQEVVDVTVTLGDRQLTQLLDGKPVLIDPGSHTFKFEATDKTPVEKTVVVRAGEKYRQIAVMFESKNPKPVVAMPALPPPVPPTSHARHVPIGSYVLGGVGVLALGGFAVFRAVGSGDYDHLQSNCAPNCSASEIDKVKQKYLISNVALGVGAAAFVGALVLFVVQPQQSSGADTAFMVSPGYNGFMARAVTRF
jgi:hypothetical protein